jgi:hypothetical protein
MNIPFIIIFYHNLLRTTKDENECNIRNHSFCKGTRVKKRQRKNKCWCTPICHKCISYFLEEPFCRNPSLGLAIKAKGLQGYGLRRKPGSHISCSRECQRVWGNDPSHSQVNSMLGVRVPMDSQIFRAQLQGLKLIVLKSSLYHWKVIKT